MRPLLLIFILLLGACSEPAKQPSFTKPVMEAHKMETFLKQEAVQFDLMLSFNYIPRINGTITMLTNSAKLRIDLENGVSLIFNGNKVYQMPDSAEYPKARFDIFTWTYFFLFPYKMNDPGTVWENYPDSLLNGKEYITQKLTFKNQVGDSPEDWYIVYVDPSTHLIHATAYVVTYNRSISEAEKNPHAIQYMSYENISGIPVATHWKFWEWDEKDGFTKEIGNGYLTNVKFITVDNNLFEPKENFRLIE